MVRRTSHPSNSAIRIDATVDRIEGAFAVLDATGLSVQIPRKWLPAGVSEGQGVTIAISCRDASALEASVRARLARLTRRGG